MRGDVGARSWRRVGPSASPFTTNEGQRRGCGTLLLDASVRTYAVGVYPLFVSHNSSRTREAELAIRTPPPHQSYDTPTSSPVKPQNLPQRHRDNFLCVFLC
jgi:hypothetical protein